MSKNFSYVVDLHLIFVRLKELKNFMKTFQGISKTFDYYLNLNFKRLKKQRITNNQKYLKNLFCYLKG